MHLAHENSVGNTRKQLNGKTVKNNTNGTRINSILKFSILYGFYRQSLFPYTNIMLQNIFILSEYFHIRVVTIDAVSQSCKNFTALFFVLKFQRGFYNLYHIYGSKFFQLSVTQSRQLIIFFVFEKFNYLYLHLEFECKVVESIPKVQQNNKFNIY